MRHLIFVDYIPLECVSSVPVAVLRERKKTKPILQFSAVLSV
jgi:hypothetical protein